MRSTLLLTTVLLFTGLHAQTPVTVSIAPGYADQVWYSLQNGVVGTAPVNNWDLAFEIQGFTASVLVNTQKAGVEVVKSPFSIAEWSSVDTTGLSTWPRAHNADTSWSFGALNQGPFADEFDLGWGNYNMITHVVAGDTIFLVHLGSGAWRKLRIDGLATGTYTFTHANIDGSNELTGQINKAAYSTKNFAYWDLEANALVDREPANDAWDLTFVKYVSFIPQPYGVTGVLQNKGIEAARVAGVPPADADWTTAAYSGHINTIGFDWKRFDMQTFQWVIEDSLSYFVKDQLGGVWHLVFTGFGGSTSGTMDFTQEFVSATGLAENDLAPELRTWPNPSLDGRVTIDAGDARVLGLDVLDAAGRVVRSRDAVNLTPFTLDLHGLGAGMYTLRLTTDRGPAVARVLLR
ncbi:MAG: T9SS type A sorting domain-containing protein [Flavobacteriales bacterium]|nr:T9SS type A sorting domain-containing protein [Flavobacteriales bacterium]MBK7942569.1 T9SS type A sorting domain-containing protein [Flavobacteriales bacterium]MBK8950911.1 T9SS type A sorting domain-containing protein [Flavobacteriales bacterium]MBK9699030.1 T9SS type A sorting domain-containing protein [Flavobacteriales bacterium]